MPQAPAEKLYYEETGKGYPIVFVHEFGADHREWETRFAASRANTAASPSRRAAIRRPTCPKTTALTTTAPGREHRRDPAPSRHRQGACRRAEHGRLCGAAFRPAPPAPWRARSSSPAAARARRAADRVTFQAPRREAIRRAARARAAWTASRRNWPSSPTRVQFQNKDLRGWARIRRAISREHSAKGSALTLAQLPGAAPVAVGFRGRAAALEVPVLLVVGDEDEPCLEHQPLPQARHPHRRAVVVPEHRPCRQSRGARALQRCGRIVPRRGRARHLAEARPAQQEREVFPEGKR